MVDSNPRSEPVSERPVMLYDGECGFCRMWVDRWQAQVGSQVHFLPFQEAVDQYPAVSRARAASAVQFIETDGSVSSGAEAVARMLEFAAGKRYLRWLYLHCPGAGASSEWVYRQVAGHRNAAASILHFLSGRTIAPRTWEVARAVYPRSIGFVYLIAFVSFWWQAEGLVGRNGILPVAHFIALVQSYADAHGVWAYFVAPTLSLFAAGDWFIHLQCALGVFGAVCLVAGMLPRVCCILLWLLYLSITVLGQTFMGFQWENLLLEAGLIAIFYAPWSYRPGSFRDHAVIGFSSWSLERFAFGLARWMTWWLLFKLMLLSGLGKLASDDDVWWNLTALTMHYWTQPIPNPLAWYANLLPEGIQRLSVAVVFVIEIGCPFLIAGPRNFRCVACAAFLFLMAAIALTGNYAYFNLLTACLCLTLLDDACWPKRVRRLVEGKTDSSSLPPPAQSCFRMGAAGSVPTVTAAAALALLQFQSGMYYLLSTGGQFVDVLNRRWGTGLRVPALEIPALLPAVAEFRSVNAYGLFAQMTRTRPEIIIEGSQDGIEWLPYEFKYKPGDVNQRPPFVAPFQPRLDWQMWFAALGRWQQNDWFVRLLGRLFDGSEPVEALLAGNPFEKMPPEYIRATLYSYTFTDAATRRAAGAWWKREELGQYFPAISREEFYQVFKKLDAE